MSQSLMQKVLGEDWQRLPEVIRKHYQISGDGQSRLEGVMTIDYPHYLYPVVWLIHMFGGLVLWRGATVRAEVDKTVADGKLHWKRTLTYPDGKVDYFRSQMHYAGKNRLIETIGFGFGLTLRVTVDNGDLLYRSAGHFWRRGNFQLNIPDWLLLGSATIREHAVSKDAFYLDFTLKHPLWGVSYYYRGNFRYQSPC